MRTLFLFLAVAGAMLAQPGFQPLFNGKNLDEFVVDTPGLREVGMWGVPSGELDSCFPEFRALKEKCRFADCIHLQEPDCAVREALAGGKVDATRYASYQKLREEALVAEEY